MSFQIDRGLFLFDFVDQHAVLGVPIDADTQTIRKRYLKIARRLHPDSCASESEEDKQRASQFLSKLVNPAWEKLSQEKERVEYDLVVKLKAQQAAKQGGIELGNLGKELSIASNPDHFYRASLKSLADKQFEHLDQALDIIGQLSELNMVYLMRKEGQGAVATADANKKTIYTGSNIPDSSQSSNRPVATKTPNTSPRRESVADQYCRRAEGYTAKNNFAQAVLELRDALQLEPRNSRCHALLGTVYLRQNQATMARIHFDKALETDPQNAIAIEGKQKLDLLQQKNTGKTSAATQGTKTSAKTSPQKPSPKSNKPDDKSGGGLFGLFGGKKK
ncbi:MAG: DnaJ domain-containing protein [Oscillatoriales cyanobacterium C42_A2020_001]|nr:DnaJ domain-containing protein [Leptolyngbyaceae cyanobacterium C42_A2020_001]